MLRWATAIGRVHILAKVEMLSSNQGSSRQGHLNKSLYVYTYLKHKPKLSFDFDLKEPQLDPTMFNHNIAPFQYHYRDTKEEDLFNQPHPRGRAVTATAYASALHANNEVTWRSHLGYIIFFK